MSVYISFFRVVPRSCISATWIIYSLTYRRERAGDMFLLNLSRKMYVCMLMSQSCPTLCNPMDCSPPCFSVHWMFQVRILEWVAISSSGGSSQPKNAPTSSALAGRVFTTEPPGKPVGKCIHFMKQKLLRYILQKRSAHNFNSLAMNKSSATTNGNVTGIV